MHRKGAAGHPSATVLAGADRDYSGRVEKNDDTTPEASEPSAEEQAQAQAQEQANGNSAARGAWMATGITFFVVGVVFTIVMPDNIALGITFLGVGVVFYSLAGSAKTP